MEPSKVVGTLIRYSRESMQHVFLASIGRRATVDAQDGPYDSIEINTPKETTRSPEQASIDAEQLPKPRVLPLNELLSHLRDVDSKLRELHCKDPNVLQGIGSERLETAISPTQGCRRLGDFVQAASRAIDLHVRTVRLDTHNSALLELSQSVDRIAEEEYANVSAVAASLVQAFTRRSQSHGSHVATTSAKTRISAVRGICEGLRQGLSLVSRTNKLLASEFGHYAAPPPDCLQTQTFPMVSVLIAASHIVQSGLMLLSQSELTHYTHSELWEITRGMEELSMLTEKVQERLDEKKQGRVRQLLLERPFCGSTVPLYQRLADLCLLTDPIDSLRPASVGHIIYVLARNRSTKLTQYLAVDILKALEKPTCDADSLTEVVRREYEFCSAFLDVMTQSTELLRNLRRVQQSFDVHPKSILHKTATNASQLDKNDPRTTHRKPIHITKTESIDQFISAFPERPQTQQQQQQQVRSFPPIDETGRSEIGKAPKKVLTWSDYCEVALRHQVVGRYLQLTWMGFSQELDGAFQLVGPTNLSSPNSASPWPLMSRHRLDERIANLYRFNASSLPLPLQSGITRQIERLELMANFHNWWDWYTSQTLPDFKGETILSTEPAASFKSLFQEIQKLPLFNTSDLLTRLPGGYHKLLEKLTPETTSPVVQLEFSSRRFQHHLDIFISTLEMALKLILREVLSANGNLCPGLATASALLLSTYTRFDDVKHCLSWVDMGAPLLEYLGTVRKVSRDEGPERTMMEEISFRIETQLLQEVFQRSKRLRENIKTTKSALAAGLSRQLREIVEQEALNMQKFKYFSQTKLLAEVEKYCQHLNDILEALGQTWHAELSTLPTPIDADGDNDLLPPRNDDTGALLEPVIVEALLNFIELGITKNANILAPDGLRLFRAPLTKALVFIDRFELVDDERCCLLRRWAILSSLVENSSISSGMGGYQSPSTQLNPPDTSNRFQQYLSKNVLTPLHGSISVSTLRTLSANVRAYFQNEDVVSHPNLQPRSAKR